MIVVLLSCVIKVINHDIEVNSSLNLLLILDSLRRHQNLHLNVKPFICEICGAAYSEAKVLKRHMGKHDGTYEKRFTCEVCGLK